MRIGKKRADENAETQMVKEGQSRTKEGIHGVSSTARHDCLSCVCHNSFNSLPPPKSSLPFTVWLVRAAVAVGTEFKKAA